MFVDSFQIHALRRAAELGVTRGAVPIEHCVAIERLTAGAVTRRDLRPGDWYRIWPELVTAEHPAPQEEDRAAEPPWPMNKLTALRFLGGTVAEAARRLGVSYQAVDKWPDELPPRIADRVVAAVAREHLPAEMLAELRAGVGDRGPDPAAALQSNIPPSGIEIAVAIAGSQTALARVAGALQQEVWHWLNGRHVPDHRCPAIERGLGGRITCEELRPDVRWARVPDATWPHPSGRPTIDVAVQAEAAS